MRTSTILKIAAKMPYVVVYSVMHLDYDGMTAYFYIIGGYDSERNATLALRKQINKSQRQHLRSHGAPLSYVSEVNSHKKTVEHGLEYIQIVEWVIEDGTGYNKIRAEASIVKKDAGKELSPAMFKNKGPRGLDDNDIEHFFSKVNIDKTM